MLTFKPKPAKYDHDDAFWEEQCIGYRGKKDGRIGVVRCFECSRENYALAVAVGSCAWCGWTPTGAAQDDLGD